MLVTDTTQTELRERRGNGLLFAVLLIGLLAVGAFVWRGLDSRPISSVRIAGEFVNVSRDSLEKVVNGFLPSGFLRVDVEAIRRAAARLPWVRRVSVRRIWPDSLHIAVVERVAVAYWNDDAYLEADGSRFVPDKRSPDDGFARLTGPEGAEKKVLEKYEQLARVLGPLKTPVRKLSLDRRGAWQVELGSGLVLELGRAENLDAMAPYIASLPKILGERYGDADQIDLRYRNGFAVRWRTPANPEEEQSS